MQMITGMRHWWGRAVAAGSIGLLALLLCACVEVNQQSVINNDLTGTTTMRIGISKMLIQTLTSVGSSLGTPTPGAPTLNSSDLFADLKKQITDMGGTATDYENDNFVGIDAKLKFSSLDEMVSQINNLLGSNASGMGGPGGGSGNGGTGALVVLTTSPTSSGGIRIDGNVDPLSELNDPATSQAIPGLDATALLAGGGMVQLSFTMPGTIRNTDSLAQTNGTTVSWSFKVGDQAAAIFVESDKG
jgi:hypothetical protein